MTKSELKQYINEQVKNALHNSLEEKTSFNQKMSLNEMSQINLRETQKGKDHLDCGTYYVYVRGEGGYMKFPHFHIKSIGEGWDIRMNMDGSYNSMKNRGGHIQNDSDAYPIEVIAKEWVKQPNAKQPKLTNGEVAEDAWERSNS